MKGSVLLHTGRNTKLDPILHETYFTIRAVSLYSVSLYLTALEALFLLQSTFSPGRCFKMSC